MINELNAEMIAALKALVELHHDWSAGRASITKKFEADNNAAIKAAREILAKVPA